MVDARYYLAHAVFCIGWNAPRHRELFIQRSHTTGLHMDREHIKGAADKAKGAIKDAAGKVTGDKELRTEGKLERRKGPLTTLPAMSKTLCATHRKTNDPILM